MEFLAELWLPILLSAVFVFVVSSVIHMALPIHKKDIRKLPDEDRVIEALRSQNVQPGPYMFPGSDCMKDLNNPEVMEKYKQGPVGFITVVPSGPPAIGKSLVQWFLFSLAAGIFVAYAAWYGLGPGAEYLRVFRVTGAVAVFGYGLSYAVDSIWKGSPWRLSGKFMIDGLVYGLVTAGTFAWLWPEA